MTIIGFGLVWEAHSDCQNPNGDSCDWYKNCLEEYKPCGNDGYAIKYADHFCRRYEANYNDFSSEGQLWVNAVKKCLQKKLAPYLSSSDSCSKLKEIAFKSHVPCYIDPTGTGSPSFCNLSFWDRVQVFDSIKGAFLSEIQATAGGGWDTMIKCFKMWKK